MTKKVTPFVLLIFVLLTGARAQTFNSKSGEISFFSSTPVEDIQAISKRTLAACSITAKTIAFKVDNTSFDFPNKLMQEHFNEKYMESEKYPYSTFSGKINEAVDLSKDGEYDVTVTGKLNIHGVERERTIPGRIIVKGNEIRLISQFKVAVKDHQIEIPTLVVSKIAEIIDVKVDALLQKV